MINYSPGQVLISKDAQKSILTDIFQRQHIEACGVLIGTLDDQENWHIEQAYPLSNIFESPVYFEFAPEDLLAIELNYPGRIVGVYHSHPTGFGRASITDRKNMEQVNCDQQIPWVWFIIPGPFDDDFARHNQGQLSSDSIIAYYHYPQSGLHRINVVVETTSHEIL